MKILYYLITAIAIIICSPAGAYTVTQLTATYQSGQVFLTWKNPDAVNLKYKVYRSTTEFTASSQLNSKNFLGYVRDSSGKNIRKSQLQQQDFYFVIKAGNAPLTPDRGLYAVTCTNKKNHFYAVTVVNLSTGIEDKNLTAGSNSLNTSVIEQKSTPQPVLQNTVIQPNGDFNYEYVIWGNNQDVSTYAAFNNCGSYGYNFTFVTREPGISSPLFIEFQDNDPFAQADSSECNECNILVLDDWLPNGNNTIWTGFNTNYDMYSNNNPVQTGGTVRMYTQNRLKNILQWAKAQPNMDPTKVYSSGFSHNGYGALLTSILHPDDIAATAETSAPIIIKAFPGSDRETQWCSYYSDVNSDILNPKTGDTLPIWHVFDLSTMFNLNMNRSLPYFTGVNGRQDVTVGWVQYLLWYDSVNLNRQGGVWFWDQRNHSGQGKNFSVQETHPDFLRFSTNKSYPAFSYCSINQNPGNGDVNNGDPYGAINGYLDWDDASIKDKNCSYSIRCFIKDFYVSGVLQTQYDSCTADITLRRLQKFEPVYGDVISWKVKNSNNKIVQQGSFTFSDTLPPTIYGAKVYKTGSTLSFSITNCLKEAVPAVSAAEMEFVRTGDGYNATVDLPSACNALISVSDLSGRIISSQMIPMQPGSNTFSVSLEHGIFLLKLTSGEISVVRKLYF